jgi:hypothetical protein
MVLHTDTSQGYQLLTPSKQHVNEYRTFNELSVSRKGERLTTELRD